MLELLVAAERTGPTWELQAAPGLRGVDGAGDPGTSMLPDRNSNSSILVKE